MFSETGEGEREKNEDKLGDWLKTFPGDSYLIEPFLKMSGERFFDLSSSNTRALQKTCSHWNDRKVKY